VATGLALPPTHADIELFEAIALRGQFEFSITPFEEPPKVGACPPRPHFGRGTGGVELCMAAARLQSAALLDTNHGRG